MSKILIINAGSSSIKWTLYSKDLNIIAKGIAQRIKIKNSSIILNYNNKKEEVSIELPSFLETVKQLVNLWINKNIISDFNEIKYVAFRIVNGGIHLQDTSEVTPQTIAYLEDAIELAPVHNPGALEAVKAFKEILPFAKMTFHFDTSFHKTLPKEVYTYAIDANITDELNVRKYGFHGLNHHFITLKLQEILNKDKVNFVNLHIGNGASLAAIQDSKSIDTSMGFTPLAGVMMGTRSGDVDCSIIPYIMKHKNWDIERTIKMLNEESGLLGVSKISSDIRDVEEAKKTNERAKFAIDLYVRKIADYLINYMNKIEGKIDAIVFTAGVGENDEYIRQAVVDKIHLVKLEIDSELNKGRDFDSYKLISTKNSSIPIYIIRADEELYIAKEVKQFFDDNTR